MTGLDRAWAVTYLRHLPPELRTAPDDPKLAHAATQARAAGWDARTLATAVTARDYTGVLHPALMATQRLTELGAIPPPPARSTGDWAAGEYREAHCGRPGCDCPHTDGCYRGWVDRGGDHTTPCYHCRPTLHQRISAIPPPGQRTPADLAHIRTDRGRG